MGHLKNEFEELAMKRFLLLAKKHSIESGIFSNNEENSEYDLDSIEIKIKEVTDGMNLQLSKLNELKHKYYIEYDRKIIHEDNSEDWLKTKGVLYLEVDHPIDTTQGKWNWEKDSFNELFNELLRSVFNFSECNLITLKRL